MNLELTKSILRPFLDPEKSTLRSIFPTEFKGKLYNSAASGHHFIMVKVTMDNIIEAPEHSFPNMLSILPEYNMDIAIPLKVFIDLYNQIPVVTRNRKLVCEACEGKGKFWHFSSFYNCKSCGETGFIETSEIEKVKDPSSRITINGARHYHESIYLFLDVAAKAGVQNIFIKHIPTEKGSQVSIFELGPDIIVGMMARHISIDLAEEKINDITLDIRMK